MSKTKPETKSLSRGNLAECRMDMFPLIKFSPPCTTLYARQNNSSHTGTHVHWVIRRWIKDSGSMPQVTVETPIPHRHRNSIHAPRLYRHSTFAIFIQLQVYFSISLRVHVCVSCALVAVYRAMEGDTGIKWVKETRSFSIPVGTTWSGYTTSRSVNWDSTGNLPMSTQRQSSIPKARNPSIKGS